MSIPHELDLKAGEWVEVRSKEEILSTLDKQARLDGMPFMPEMFRYCGERLRVSKRAEKSCDTIRTGQGRKLFNTVHLEGVRCDGSGHGGCQALCLIWWREAWLKRAQSEEAASVGSVAVVQGGCSEEAVHENATVRGYLSATVYSCQVTRLLDFTHGRRWWDPRAYWLELRGGNVSLPVMLRTMWLAFLNILRRRAGRLPEPHLIGRCDKRTPSARIEGLQPGDWVVVKSKAEIEATLDAGKKNRGLFFDIEMLPYCGRRMRLLQKVDQIVDEHNGVLMKLPNDCWIIEGAVCNGYQSRNRLFCTREIYPFWREIWFDKAEEGAERAGE